MSKDKRKDNPDTRTVEYLVSTPCELVISVPPHWDFMSRQEKRDHIRTEVEKMDDHYQTDQPEVEIDFEGIGLDPYDD